MNALTPEERRALEVAECAQRAILDTMTMCARAGLIGAAIVKALDCAAQDLQRVIDTIRENN